MRKKLTNAQVKKLTALRPAGCVSILYRCGEDEIPVQLKNTLSLADTSAFIDRVALASFTAEGDYIPEYQEVMMFGAVLQFLSNVPLPELKEPETERKLLDLAKLQEMMDAMDLLTASAPCIIPRTKTNAGSGSFLTGWNAWCSKNLSSSGSRQQANQS